MGLPSPRPRRGGGVAGTLDTERVHLDASLTRTREDYLARRHRVNPSATAASNITAATNLQYDPSSSSRGPGPHAPPVISSARGGAAHAGALDVAAANGGLTGRSVLSTGRSAGSRYPAGGMPDPEQLLNESSTYAKCATANTATFPYSIGTNGRGGVNMETQTQSARRPPIISARSDMGSARSEGNWDRFGVDPSRQYKSWKRLPDYDFSVVRKNNNYSNANKLTRNDPFYSRPRLAVTNNSVKYNIVTNGVRRFRHGD